MVCDSRRQRPSSGPLQSFAGPFRPCLQDTNPAPSKKGLPLQCRQRAPHFGVLAMALQVNEKNICPRPLALWSRLDHRQVDALAREQASAPRAVPPRAPAERRPGWSCRRRWGVIASRPSTRKRVVFCATSWIFSAITLSPLARAAADRRDRRIARIRRRLARGKTVRGHRLELAMRIIGGEIVAALPERLLMRTRCG